MTHGLSLSQKELQQRVKRIAEEVFGLKITVLISKRMARAWASYCWELTPKTRKQHELCHWYTDKKEGHICGHNHKFYANCRKFGVEPCRINNYQKAEGGDQHAISGYP